MFYHSSSYTANPIACAAAVANLDVWVKEPVRERVAALAAAQSGRIASLASDERFETVRQLGTITAVDFRVERAGYLAAIGPKLYVALGISGAIQHMIGVANTETIVAVNSDPNAAILKQCDYYIVGNVEDTVPQLVEALEKA